ncbi:MAG TPA: TonB-dependent receptor [Bacteriovoracaceae bacterium]|nr:TonB-dependent receptor [Bacteriovoracaceae bacterium]
MKPLILLSLILISLNLSAHMESERLDDIQVMDHNESQNLVDFVPSVTQIKGRELQKRRQTSIGEMLQNEAGVSSTSFGPSASRPVIRGLEGDRIRILQNGLGTLDASTQSLDHAVPVDTMTIDQIELVRGPMSLLYGSSAVGGVVNLLTNRIHAVYEEGFFSQALIQGETVNNGLSSALHLNYGKSKWMLHADGSTRNLSDQRLPSHSRGGVNQVKGKLPNSFNKQDNVAVGASRIMDQGHFGLSLNHFNTNYGSVAEEEIKIDMTQNRAEFHSEWRPEEGRLFRKLKFKSAQSDYKHLEIENGETGTTFKNQGNESRLEGMNKNDDLEGVTGIQTQIFKFSAKGDEAFLPTSDNARMALFTYQQLGLNEKNSLSFGSRVENADVNKRQDAIFGPGDSRNFVSINGSVGHLFKFNTQSSLATSLSYTERAPNFQELYALGDHLASGSYEEGESTLVKEKAYAFEVSFKANNQIGKTVVSAYTQVFKDFIVLNPTGNVGTSPNGLIEYEYDQADALFYGADLENRRELSELNKGVLTFISTADVVRAKDTDTGKNLPRISPPRISMGLEYAKDKWNTDIEVQHVTHQTKTSPNERWTDSYTLTNVGYMYNIIKEESNISLFGRVRNLFDVEARSHVSILKEIAPMPGRNLIIGIQAHL